jgi:thiamine transporter ThiT
MSLVIAIAALALVGIYDGYCQITGKPTLSKMVWQASVKYPFVPFAAGLVAGHLFWNNSGACP